MASFGQIYRLTPLPHPKSAKYSVAVVKKKNLKEDMAII